jgi:purine-binding chemotaxis protein CheW
MDEMSAAKSGRTDPAALAGKLASRSKMLRQRVEERAKLEARCTFVAFHKGRQRYGIAMDEILEIRILDRFTFVPGSPAFVPGVINWRGAILSLLDLCPLFGLPETGLADAHECLVVEAAGVRVAVLAGQIEDIVSVPADQIRTAPELPGDTPEAWVVGVHDENRLVLSMDQLLRDPRLSDRGPE